MRRSGSKSSPTAVVVGLNDASLPIIRSLGRKGIRIFGLFENPLDYCVKSKFLSLRVFQKPLYGRNLVDALMAVGRSLSKPAVLFCATDRSVLTVSEYEQKLNPYFRFVLPSYEATNTQISKRRFQEFALRNSFLTPKTFFTSCASDIRKIAEKLPFPCVIKPEYRDKYWYSNVPKKVLYAETKPSFLRQVEEYQIQDRPLVIQEWIEGDDSSVYFCLVYISRQLGPLAIITGKKLAQHPHLTGSTSVAETIRLPELVDESLRLLLTAGCVGFCSVEFKLSNKDGLFYVTEPTIGRPDTQEGICLSAGIDIPYIAYLDAMNRDLKPLGKVKQGIKWINEPLAFYSLQRYLRNRPDFASLLSLLKGNRSYCYWTIDDPMPALTLLIKIVIRGLRRIPKRLGI
jgi:D-aspartate ligase